MAVILEEAIKARSLPSLGIPACIMIVLILTVVGDIGKVPDPWAQVLICGGGFLASLHITSDKSAPLKNLPRKCEVSEAKKQGRQNVHCEKDGDKAIRQLEVANDEERSEDGQGHNHASDSLPNGRTMDIPMRALEVLSVAKNTQIGTKTQ